MPRRSKGAHLWLRPERRNSADQLVRRSCWIIIDSGKHFATGCLESEIESAQIKLAAYIAAKYQPNRKERDIEEIDVADVSSIYD